MGCRRNQENWENVIEYIIVSGDTLVQKDISLSMKTHDRLDNGYSFMIEISIPGKNSLYIETHPYTQTTWNLRSTLITLRSVSKLPNRCLIDVNPSVLAAREVPS